MAGTQIATTADGKQLTVVVEPTIEVVEEGVGNVESGREVATTADSERVGEYQHVGDDDERTGNAEGGRAVATTGETPEQLSARQRRRRADQAKRNQERQELVALRQRNQQLEAAILHTDQRVARVEISAVDQQITTLEAEIGRADSVIARAITANNGEDAMTAMQIRDTLRDRLNGFKAEKAKSVETARQQAQGQPQGQQQQGSLPPGITPAQVGNYNIFASRHPWYDPKGGDEESRTAKALDKALQDEGSDPNMADHWLELEKRIRETLPRYTKAANGGGEGGQPGGKKPNGAGGPRLPGSGAGGGGGQGGTVQFHLSAARKQALIDLGVYGTPEQTKYIKNFMAWDKLNPGTKQ